MKEEVPVQNFSSNNSLRDIEERQKIIKDRLLLIGQNLIDFKKQYNEEILDLKLKITELSKTNEKIKHFLETISGEISKFAKKEDLEILKKQAKMFQPLDFVTHQELKSHYKKK